MTSGNRYQIPIRELKLSAMINDQQNMHSSFENIVPIPISVLIAYGHLGMASDLARILANQSDVNVMLACTSGRLAAAAVQQLVPDVALLDVNIADLSLTFCLASRQVGSKRKWCA